MKGTKEHPMPRGQRLLKRLVKQEREGNFKPRNLRPLLRTALKRQMLHCSQCGKQSRFEKWTFVQAYWREGGGWNAKLPLTVESCHITCPNRACRHSTLIVAHPQKSKILKTLNDFHFSAKEIFVIQVETQGETHGSLDT